MKKLKFDLTGLRFGRLTIIKYIQDIKKWYGKCDCGGYKLANSSHLREGRIISCGCAKKENCGVHLFKHGDASGGRKTSEYKTWKGMKERCRYVKHIAYENYGGRGIKVCERWINSFENFLSDMGRRPTPKHTLDRIDNDGNYEPSNCKWSTRSEQRLNQRPRRLSKKVI